MSDIATQLRRRWPEAAWGLFALANLAAMVLLDRWETIPFHLIWVSLTLLYGLRVWAPGVTTVLLAVVGVTTGAAMFVAIGRTEGLDEMTEIPLMSAMFLAMVWHARRRQAAMEEVRRSAESEHKSLERQRDFVRDASHELRTPITIARGHAELIRDAHGDGQMTRDADVVLDELHRLSRLSERLLILASSGHPGFLRRRQVFVEPLIEETFSRWRSTFSRKWEMRVEAEGTLQADEERLRIALDALLENAVKSTTSKDRVTVRMWAHADCAVFEVADTGEGIPDDRLPRIFDRFARTDGGRARRAGGTGLGLSIVKAIVEAHGGEVDASSALGAGSTFRMRLPGFQSLAIDPPAGVTAVDSIA
jgi:two-component system, OmpR family, sensor kinase